MNKFDMKTLIGVAVAVFFLSALPAHAAKSGEVAKEHLVLMSLHVGEDILNMHGVASWRRG